MHRSIHAFVTRLPSALFAAAGLLATLAPARAQEVFASPEAAATALVQAAAGTEPGFVDRIFGPGARDLLASGDEAEDRRRLKAFVDAAAEGRKLESPTADRRVLVLGANGWPFPVPIVKRDKGWVFDVDAGRDELLNRTIGFNETSAIGACRAYVEAQREFFRQDRDGDDVQEYAQRIISRPGRHDGLYWPAENPADRSPLEGLISTKLANRVAAGGKPEPYRGYRFKILKAQGKAAPGGAYNYVINGRMIAGFALVAYPDDWGRSGIMTFICNQQGKVFEKNLGPDTAAVAGAMTRYDPGAGWTPAD